MTAHERLAQGFRLMLLLALPAVPASVPGQQTSANDSLIGTWTLTDAAASASDEPASDDERSRLRGSRGVLILDGAGNVFEYFSIGGDEQQSTLEQVGGFWGRYEADHAAGTIAFEALDGVSPRVQGLSFSRSFELDGDRLIVTSADEPDAQGHVRLSWQRTPIVENLSPTYRDVIGFWQHIEEGQLAEGEVELENPRRRAPSVIVYTPSGFVGVHFPSLDRNADNDDDPDGPGSYIGYFGTLNVYPGEVSHNVLSGISPGTGSILRRYAEINGDELLVTLQATGGSRGAGDRPRASTIVRLKRLSGADDMLPAAP